MTLEESIADIVKEVYWEELSLIQINNLIEGWEIEKESLTTYLNNYYN